jgi:hypothetical protein
MAFCGVTMSWLPGSAVMVSSLQMLGRGRSATVVVELVSCRWLKYIYFVVWLESPDLNIVICRLEYLLWPCGNDE